MILTGCIRDEHDPRDYVYRPETGSLFGSDDADLRAYLPEIWDQGANDCVAHALTAAVMGRASVQGHTVPRPSVLYSYANSRQLATGQLFDSGTNCRSMLKSMSGRTVEDSRGALYGLGMVPEDDWPEAPENINVAPPDDLLRKGETWCIGSYARIPDGTGAIDGLKHALAAKLFPTICLVVDMAFANLGGTVYHGNDGSKVLGGHALLCVGYSTDANAFLVRNSWGTGWGQDGYGWLSQTVVANHAYDMWCIT